MPILRSSLLFGLFALTVLLLSFPLSTTFGPRESWQRRLDFFLQHHEQFDFVVVGSSHVYRNVHPKILESEFSSPACEPRGFDVGVAGYGGHGIDYILRRLGDTLNGKVVLIEAFSYGSAMRPDAPGRYAARDVQWHTLPRTASVIRTAFDEAFQALPPSVEPHSLANRIILLSDSMKARSAAFLTAAQNAAPHLRLWAERILPLGLVWRITNPELEEPDGDPPGVDLMHSRGFNPLLDENHRMQLSPDEWREHIRAIVESRRRFAPSGPNDAAFRRQLQFLASVRPRRVFYILFPHAYGDSARWITRFENLQTNASMPPGLDPVLLDYNRPESFPDLFAYEARFDSSHLTEARTRDFSHRLGRDVLSHFHPDFCADASPDSP